MDNNPRLMTLNVGMETMLGEYTLHTTHAQIKHANHMTMTTSGQIMPWSDWLKTKGNVKIKLQDLCKTLIVYILLSTF